MCGDDIGIFLSEIVLGIAVVHRLELNLKAVVSRCRWRCPGHSCGRGTVGAAFYPKIHISGTDWNTDRANSELEKEKATGMFTTGACVELFQTCATTSYVVPGWRAEEENWNTVQIELDVRIVPGHRQP